MQIVALKPRCHAVGNHRVAALGGGAHRRPLDRQRRKMCRPSARAPAQPACPCAASGSGAGAIEDLRAKLEEQRHRDVDGNGLRAPMLRRRTNLDLGLLRMSASTFVGRSACRRSEGSESALLTNDRQWNTLPCRRLTIERLIPSSDCDTSITRLHWLMDLAGGVAVRKERSNSRLYSDRLDPVALPNISVFLSSCIV